MSRKIALIASIQTLTALILSSQEKLDAANSQLAQFDAIAAVDVGSNVVFLIGRAETRREVTGLVKAVRQEEGVTQEDGSVLEGKRSFKVEYTETGDAFDAVVSAIAESQIIRVA